MEFEQMGFVIFLLLTIMLSLSAVYMFYKIKSSKYIAKQHYYNMEVERLVLVAAKERIPKMKKTKTVKKAKSKPKTKRKYEK